MSANCYEIACQHAANELAEINAQLQRLTLRKQRLENLLEPLMLLVSGSTPLELSGTVSNPESDVATPQLSSVVVLVGLPEPRANSMEASATVLQHAMEAVNGHETGHGHSASLDNGEAISDDAVAQLAYRYWNERGQAHGYHDEDWARAAAELRSAAA